MRRARLPSPAPRILWMQPATVVFASVIIATLAAAAVSEAYPRRALLVGAEAGVRSFERRLDLETEPAGGIRFGVVAAPGVAILMDAAHSSTAEKRTHASVGVSTLRLLARLTPFRGRARPYLLLGGGGILFNYAERSDTALGAFTGGCGIEVRVARRLSIYGEVSGDFYRHQLATYGPTGNRTSLSERSTDATGLFAAGFETRF